MSYRWIVALALAGLMAGAGCDDGRQGFTGRYQLQVFESRDTCDGVTNSFGSSLVAERTDSQVTVTFGDEWEVTGTFDSQGILQAQGTVVEDGENTTTLQVQIRFFTTGTGLEGNGRVIYDGTFPGMAGACQQDLVFNGTRPAGALAPIFPTGPDAR